MKKVYPLKVRLTAAAGAPTRVDVYDDIGQGGWFSDGVSAKDFAASLAGVKGALEVHINSAGGDVFDGITIRNTIAGHKGPVTVVVDGLAASIASVIAQAGQERVMQPGSMMMIHDAFGGCVGDAAEMTKMAGVLDQVSDNIAAQYADRAGGTAEQWRDTMRQETWYDADEAVAAGLADRVGDKEAELPAGLDLTAAFEMIPGRIAARLRAMPVAAMPKDAAGGDCKTCGGTGRLKHPSTGKPGKNCPGCGGSGNAPADDSTDDDGTDDNTDGDGEGGTDTDSDVEGDDDGSQDAAPGVRNGPGRPYKPAPYRRDPDETVQCPVCKKFNDIDATYCDQCGTKLAGRSDVEETAGPGADALTADDIRALIRHEIAAASGQPGTHGDHERFDPDGDGDCDACPEGDTDHDYWTAGGKQLQSVPGKPMPSSDALTAEDIRALLREELEARFGNAASVDHSPWDAAKAWHNGAESDDPAKFYAGICAGEKAGDKSTQDAWALPYKYTPSSPPNAAGVKNALSRLPQTQDLTNEAEAKATLQAEMKKINPDYEPADKAPADLSGISPEQFRAALRGARQ